MRSDDRASQWRHVAITGASSGIGAALARRLAAPGRRLSLAGRDMARLEAVASECAAKGAETLATSLDVTDRAAVAAWLDAGAREQPLDLVICNAGILEEAGRTPQQVVEVNLLGTMNTMGPAIGLMRSSGGGRIAVTISLAAFRPQWRTPAYAASKAAVRIYAEGMRATLRAMGIELSVVCPGIVATPMIEGHQVPMRFLVSADRGAEIIVDGLARGRSQVYFPWILYAKARLMAFLPTGLVDRLDGTPRSSPVDAGMRQRRNPT